MAHAGKGGPSAGDPVGRKEAAEEGTVSPTRHQDPGDHRAPGTHISGNGQEEQKGPEHPPGDLHGLPDSLCAPGDA